MSFEDAKRHRGLQTTEEGEELSPQSVNDGSAIREEVHEVLDRRSMASRQSNTSVHSSSRLGLEMGMISAHSTTSRTYPSDHTTSSVSLDTAVAGAGAGAFNDWDSVALKDAVKRE
jgi:hypothetical protein